MTALDFPDNPFTGQVFDRWVYDGSKWVMGGGGVERPRLVAYHKQSSGDTDGMGGAWTRLNGMDATFNVEAGRTYRIMARCRFEMEASASNGLGNLAITRGTAYSGGNGLVFWRGALGPTGPGNVRIVAIEDYWVPTADAPGQLITVHAALDNSPAGIWSHRPRPDSAESLLIVEDVT